MFRKLLPIYAVAALAASVLLPSPIQAQHRAKMDAAWVYLGDWPTSCDYSVTNVNVQETWRPRNERGGMAHRTMLTFRSTNYDICEELLTSYIEGSVEIPASAFRLQGLKSATLQVAVDFRNEVDGTIVPVIFDMAMTCIEVSEEGNGSGGHCVSMPSGSLLVRGRNLVDAPERDGQLTRLTGIVSQGSALFLNPVEPPGFPSPIRAQDLFKASYVAYASFSDAPAGCEYLSNTVIEVLESWRSQAERQRVEHEVTLYFRTSGYDCQGVFVPYVEGFVEIPTSAFRSQALKSATLQAAVDFRDEARGVVVPVIFDVTWTCEQSSISGKLSSGACENAEPSGTILVAGRNLVDSDYSEGQLVSFKKD